MSTTKKGKLHVKVSQISGSERLHIILPVKYWVKTGASPFLLTCKLLQGGKIYNEKRHFTGNCQWQYHLGNIILDCQIKT